MCSESPTYPRVLFFFMGSKAEGEVFFARQWPGVRAVADKDKTFYLGLGLVRGTLGQLLGPKTLARGVGALLRGHGIGKPVGDPLQMPGFYIVRDGVIMKQYLSRTAGDHPNLAEFAKV